MNTNSFIVIVVLAILVVVQLLKTHLRRQQDVKRLSRELGRKLRIGVSVLDVNEQIRVLTDRIERGFFYHLGEYASVVVIENRERARLRDIAIGDYVMLSQTVEGIARRAGVDMIVFCSFMPIASSGTIEKQWNLVLHVLNLGDTKPYKHSLKVGHSQLSINPSITPLEEYLAKMIRIEAAKTYRRLIAQEQGKTTEELVTA